MKLLIIEDDINLATTLARRLSKQGFQCQLAHTSEQAMKLAECFSPTYVLLDLKLADENGLALIKPLRAILLDATIVLLTGFASIASAVEAMRLGANDYLTKPVDFRSLLNALKNTPLDDEQRLQVPVMSAERVEWEHIQHVLYSNNGNISETARQLNMHRRTLQRKLQKKPVQQ
ncbi:response regulator transcription factor [Pseudoalteromonas mariniglutinosa]|uniref:response regulator transcription factor n=1 Tax=Pseudoalteromonas mariniglutinosa TaxID=206042 RepID=UPI00384CAF38